ncbi:MAG: prolyl oligopeptidase family protein [Myxococcota bacterium]
MQSTRRSSGSTPDLRTLLTTAARLELPAAEPSRRARPLDGVDVPGKKRGKKAKHQQRLSAGFAGAAAALDLKVLLAQLGAQIAFEATYPKTERGDVVDDYHGVKVPDPYRWLEVAGAKRNAWVDEQNAFTRSHIDKLPARKLVADWLERSFAVGEKSRERKVKDFTFFTERKGGEHQASLFVKDKQGKVTCLVNPAALDPSATMHVSSWSVSPDGTKVAYALNDNGSDWATWHLVDAASGEKLPDVIEWTKTNSIEWLPDSSGFLYGGLPAPEPGKELQEVVHDYTARLHKVGTPQSADTILMATPEAPDTLHEPSLSDDEKWLIVSSGDMRTGKSRIAVRPIDDMNAPFRTVLESSDAEYQVLGGSGSVVYLLTDAEAPNARLVAIDLAEDKPVVRELLPQDPQMTLDGATVVGERIYARYLNNGTAALRVFHKGSLERTIDLPDRGTVSAFWGDPEGKKVQFTFQNHYTPEIEYAVDTETGKRRITRPSPIGVDPADYVTTESFFKSTDGTMVPVFITQRRDTPRDGNAPTLQYAYGGFRNSVTPTYSRRFHAWLEMGGIVAVPQLRGGREFGENWHKGGSLGRKQNVFEDFKACARHLVEQRYTRHDRLTLAGASNGGLLVAATVVQDPSIAAAGLVGVGVHDMLRYHLWTWGPGWIPEYGVSSNPQQFPFLHAFSPLHNVRKGVRFPGLLVETGNHDDRVEPSHSYKLLAALQAAQAGRAPTLLRVDKDTGHGSGKPVGKVIDQTADEIAFALNEMNASAYAANLTRGKLSRVA